VVTTHRDDDSPESPTDPYEEAHDMVERLRTGVKDEKEKSRAARSFWRELPILIVIALAVAVVIKTFLVQAFYIPSASMRDTLLEGDRVMVNKLAYRVGDVARGDVVVFDEPLSRSADGESLPAAVVRNIGEAIGLSHPASDFIKRIIGLPGETLEIHDGVMHVDGAALDEPYLHPDTRMPDYGPITVPPGFVFVMGDNRNQSQDSRYFGPIPVGDIVGKAFVILWPPSHWRSL
jgi:signal peptidase I